MLRCRVVDIFFRELLCPFLHQCFHFGCGLHSLSLASHACSKLLPILANSSPLEYPGYGVPVACSCSAFQWQLSLSSPAHRVMPFSFTYPPLGINDLSSIWCASNLQPVFPHITQRYPSRSNTAIRNASLIAFFLFMRTELIWFGPQEPHLVERLGLVKPFYAVNPQAVHPKLEVG